MPKNAIHKLGDILLRPFREHFLFLVSFFVLATAIHVIRFIRFGHQEHSVYVLIHCIALSYIVTLVVSLIRQTSLRKIIQGIIIFIAGISFIINTYCLFALGSLLEADHIMLALDTNVNEAKEFFSTLVPRRLAVKIIAIPVLLAILWAISIYHPIKLGKKWSIAALWLVGLCAIENVIDWSIWEDGPIGHATELLTALRNNDVPDESQLNHTPPTVTLNEGSDIPTDVVLIIGESFARFHSSLYGYDKMTNPYLGALHDSSLLFVIDSIDAPAPTTSVSLQLMLTTSYRSILKDKDKKWYDYPSIIELMKVCGYDCYWFSNQARYGKYNYAARVFAQSCDQHFFFRQGGIFENYTMLDMVLVDSTYQFAEAQHQHNKHSFMIYHLMGSRFDYNQRYPEDFNHFTEKDYKNYPEHQCQVLATYDNSILYNDYVVNQIIDIYKDEDALIIYVPDHGQDLFRSSPDYHTHGKMNDPVSFAYGVEIPFMIYASPSFQKKNPEIIQRIINRQNEPRPWNSEGLPFLIMDLIGARDINGEEVKPKSLL